MPSDQQQPSDSRRKQQRPTLPSIRDILGRELSQAVPPQQARISSSPQIPFQHLALTDDERRSRAGSPAPRAHTQEPPAYTRSGHHAALGAPGTHSHARTPQASSHLHAYGTQPPAGQDYAHHGQIHPFNTSQRMSGGEMPTGIYPYSVPQSQYPGQPMPVASSSRATTEAVPAERSASSRYECSYCHKGFTRPSSLKIHLNTHTGEKPFTCPHPGCGRSFSVQSNMRRHARVHERGSESQPELDEENVDEGEDV